MQNKATYGLNQWRTIEISIEKLRDTPRQENFIITVKDMKQADHVQADHVQADHVQADHVQADHVQGFWFKKATSLHAKLKQHLQEWMNAGQVPTWMDTQYLIIRKDKSK